MKVGYHEISDFERKKYLGEFYSVVAQLKTRDEVKKFFKDLLFLSEIVMLSRRIQIAKMLMEGETHDSIRMKMRVGYGTIADVERWLKRGFGGYKEMIGRYNKSVIKKNYQSGGGESPYSMRWLRKKYPLHFLLVNLIKKD